MTYYFSKILPLSMDDAVEKVTEVLKEEGFGVLTEIDVKATLKKKIDADFRDYRILGACNPVLAHKALQEEENIGLMLPCNVVVQKTNDGFVSISAIDPVASMMGIENDSLGSIATEVREKMQNVINSL